MSRILTTKEMAAIVEQDLNTISNTLYDSGEILSQIVFFGTDDSAIYERYQKGEYDLTTDIRITPFILESINFYQLREEYLRYEETFGLNVYGFFAEKTDLEKIFNYYTNIENTSNKTEVIDSIRIEKETGRIDFDIEEFPQDGSDEHRIQGALFFTWQFLGGGLTSDNVEVLIGGEKVPTGERIPYKFYNFENAKRNISSMEFSTEGITQFLNSTYGFLITMTLPLLTDSDTIMEIYEDVYKKRYNKKYTFSFRLFNGDEDYFTFTDDIQLAGGNSPDPKPSVLDFDVMFIRAPKSIEIYIDTVRIPVLEYSYSFSPQSDNVVNINDDKSKSVNVASSFNINMTLPLNEDDENTKINEIYEDIHNRDISKEYTIRIKRGTLFDNSYNVILGENNSFNADTDANQSFECSFIEVDGDL
jgi:hypothetical protein